MDRTLEMMFDAPINAGYLNALMPLDTKLQ